MRTPWTICLIDLTTSSTPDSMRPAPFFMGLIEAWTEQITGSFADDVGLLPVTFQIIADPNDRPAGAVAMNFRDTIPEAPGALAYHQDTNGVPDIELGVDLFASLTDQNESLSEGGSHELLEMLRDPGANRWGDKGDGNLCALESCDIVQNTQYQASNGIWVSNFALESYFMPGGAGPFDHLGVLTSQSDTSFGYEIQCPAPTEINQVGGMIGKPSWPQRWHSFERRLAIVGKLTDKQRKQKSHPHSRAYRRGLRLAV